MVKEYLLESDGDESGDEGESQLLVDKYLEVECEEEEGADRMGFYF